MKELFQILSPVIIPLVCCYFTRNQKKYNAKIIMVSLVIFIIIIYFDGSHSGPIQKEINHYRCDLALLGSLFLFIFSIFQFIKERRQKK